jgi:hypothetical protein
MQTMIEKHVIVSYDGVIRNWRVFLSFEDKEKHVEATVTLGRYWNEKEALDAAQRFEADKELIASLERKVTHYPEIKSR